MVSVTNISTTNFKKTNADNFISSLEDHPIYIGLGKTSPWNIEIEPEEPIDSQEYLINTWNNIIELRKILQTNSSLLTKRINWEYGNTYDEYSHDMNIEEKKFYVITDELNVYKCINNNNNSISTIKPTGTSLDTFQTEDGYIWKFLFRIDTIRSVKFLSNEYFPIRKVTSADEDQLQWEVQQHAIGGTIDNIKVIETGSLYQYAEGISQAATNNNIKLESNSSPIDDIYIGYSISIISGTLAHRFSANSCCSNVFTGCESIKLIR